MKQYRVLIAIGVIILAFSAGKILVKTSDEPAIPPLQPLKWEIETNPAGTMMFLDVPFKDQKDTTVFLTINLQKDSGAVRPRFISFMLPSPIDDKKGMYLTYGKSDTKDPNKIIPVQELTTHLNYQDCNSDFCVTRLLDGFAARGEKHEKADIFSELSTYDFVMIVFFYSDGTHKSLSVPLASFKKEWESLR